MNRDLITTLLMLPQDEWDALFPKKIVLMAVEIHWRTGEKAVVE